MPRETDLSGTWEALPVSRFDGKYSSPGRPVQVPGHWQQTPEFESYAGKMVYRRPFKFMPDPTRRFFLKIGGAFYWATAYLNDVRLGANEGYFFPVEYEITGLLHKDNSILIEVDCPNEDDKTAKRQLTGVFHHWDCIDPESNPGGIWLPVEIIGTGAARIVDPLFRTDYIARDGKSARVSGEVTIDLSAPSDLLVRVSFIPKTFTGETHTFERALKKSAGVHTYQYYFDLPEPALWWTHGHGRPDLYTLKIEVFTKGAENPSDVLETLFGVRTFEMKNYIARLNGKRLYLRGSNYAPTDLKLAAANYKRCAQDVKLAREANLNFLRVHAHVGHPDLYRACDEQGVILWQDFPMQWYYRAEVEAQAGRQVRRMIYRLGNHPSIGVWCMHNEPIRQFDAHKFFGPLAIIRWLFSIFVWNPNRGRLDKELARKARYLDPHRFVTECSGVRGLWRKTGDEHSYFGWYFGPLRWFHRQYGKHPDRLRFVTEFGAQSFPNLESAREFTGESLAGLDWKKLKARHGVQPGLLKTFVNPKRFKSLEAYIAATQKYQSEVIRYYIDRLRALKYKPGGGFAQFSFHDAFPAILWSVLDYHRKPKESYFALQRAASPVYAFLIMDKTKPRRGDIVRIPVWAVNDTWEEARAAVSLKVISPAGDLVLEETREETLPADCEARVMHNPEVRLRWEGKYRVEIILDSGGEKLRNDYTFKVKA